MKTINNIVKKDWIMLVVIILSFIVGAYFYPSLPARVPIHWNASGQVDNYGSKLFGAFGLPTISLGIYILFIILPYIDPKRKNYDSFKSTYQLFKYIMIVFFLAMQVVTLLIDVGVAIEMSIFIQIMISLLFIIMGNVMGKLKHNYFVGIKTPWTLADERVWRKTHRLAGPLWVIGGILNVILSLMGLSRSISFIFILIIIVIVPVAYSYAVYKNMDYKKE